MTRISTLLCASLLLITPTAMAQTYSIGSDGAGDPQSSAQFNDEGIGFPDFSPQQIAADVTTQFNPRTGAREYVAPTFDPFELDDDLAGTVSLRGTDGARDLNNDLLRDGSLLDVSVFYTDSDDRPFGLTRDALFLSGESVPVVLSDSRELECSARVTERIYRYDRYDGYRGTPYWTRPDYYGHGGFAYGGYGSYGGYGVLRPRRRPAVRPGVSPRPRPWRRPGRVTPDRPDVAPRVDDSGQGRPRGNADYFINGRKAGTKPAPDRRPRRPGRGAGQDSGASYVSPDVTVTPSVRVRPQPVTRHRIDRRPAPRPTTRPAPRPERVVAPAPAPRVRPAPKPAPRPAPEVKPAPKKRVAPVSRPRPRSDPSERTRIQHDMFPGDGYGSTVVVSSQRDCAREDQLTLFIPNERLDAARFDGLTLIMRDVTYDQRTGQTTVYNERPVYIPPNYIQGFRIAQGVP